MHAIEFRLHLGENAAELLSLRQKIIGPLDIDLKTRLARHDRLQSYRSAESEQGRESRWYPRPQDQREVETVFLFRMPGTAEPSPSGCLQFGDDCRAVNNLSAMIQEARRKRIGGIHRIKVKDVSSQRLCSQPWPDPLGKHDVGNAGQ